MLQFVLHPSFSLFSVFSPLYSFLYYNSEQHKEAAVLEGSFQNMFFWNNSV